MTFAFITYEKRDRVAVVTINRPESMNALHLEAHLELKEAWEDFRDDPDLWWRSSRAPEIGRSVPATT